MTIKKTLENLIPFSIGCIIAAISYSSSGWWGVWLKFPWIGAAFSVAVFVADSRRGLGKDLGRRIAIAMFGGLLLVFFQYFGRENMQIEELVFYLAAGSLSHVVIHYTIAKVIGPLIFGRGFCGWACWIAAVLEWLPIKANKPIPKKLTYIRYPILTVSLLIPILAIIFGYDYMSSHITGWSSRTGQLYWFFAGNALYYAAAIPMAFAFGKKRAFCKIACPVSLIMKVPSRFALLKPGPTDKECISCGACNKHCPMDVDVMGYITNKKKVLSTECIQCEMCKSVCPVGAVR